MKNCKYCQKELRKKDKEYISDFNRRKCCDMLCARKLKIKTLTDYNKKHGNWNKYYNYNASRFKQRAC